MPTRAGCDCTRSTSVIAKAASSFAIVEEKAPFPRDAKTVQNDAQRRHSLVRRDDRPDSFEHTDSVLEPHGPLPRLLAPHQSCIERAGVAALEIERAGHPQHVALARELDEPDEFLLR